MQPTAATKRHRAEGHAAPHNVPAYVAAICERHGATPDLIAVACGDGRAFARLLRAPAPPTPAFSQDDGAMTGADALSLAHYAALAGQVEWVDACRRSGRSDHWHPYSAGGVSVGQVAACGGHVAVLQYIATLDDAGMRQLRAADGVSVVAANDTATD